MPSPFHGERLKALRTEAGWSQAELAEKIDSDARQVSRYENNKVAPGLEARLADLGQLTDEERATITNVIDALVTKTRLRLITGGAG